MNSDSKGSTLLRKLKPILAIAVLSVVGLLFVSGVAIFVYQMLRAG